MIFLSIVVTKNALHHEDEPPTARPPRTTAVWCVSAFALVAVAVVAYLAWTSLTGSRKPDSASRRVSDAEHGSNAPGAIEEPGTREDDTDVEQVDAARSENPQQGGSDLVGSGRQQEDALLVAHQAGKLDLSVLEQLVNDPSRDGWETESLNDAITAQLKSIGKAAAHPQIDVDDVSKFVAQDFHCESLRPGPLQIVFQDASLLVRRPPENLEKQSSDTYAGTDGLVEALRALREPFAPSADLRPEHHTALGGNAAASSAIVNSEAYYRLELALIQLPQCDELAPTRLPLGLFRCLRLNIGNRILRTHCKSGVNVDLTLQRGEADLVAAHLRPCACQGLPFFILERPTSGTSLPSACYYGRYHYQDRPPES